MVSLSSQCSTFCRSLIGLNSLALMKSRFVYVFWRQTDKQTNRRTSPLRKAALAVASGGLKCITLYRTTMNWHTVYHFGVPGVWSSRRLQWQLWCPGQTDASRQKQQIRSSGNNRAGHSWEHSRAACAWTLPRGEAYVTRLVVAVLTDCAYTCKSRICRHAIWLGCVAQWWNVGLWPANFSCSALQLTSDHLSGKPSAVRQPTRPTQPFILSG